MGPFGLPTMIDLVSTMERQELVLGLFLLGVGLVFMLIGVRIFTVLVAVSFGVLGFGLGQMLPVSELLRWVCGFLGAVGLAVASTFVVKLSVAVLAGGWSGYVVALLAARFGLGEQTALILGGLALVAAASLTFVMYAQIIAFVTSLQGALLFLGGLVVILSHSPSFWNYLRGMLIDNPIFGPFLVLAGTVTGFYFQLAEVRRKDTGTSG